MEDFDEAALEENLAGSADRDGVSVVVDKSIKQRWSRPDLEKFDTQKDGELSLHCSWIINCQGSTAST